MEIFEQLEIFLIICDNLDIVDITKLSLVSKLFHHMCTNDTIWNIKFCTDFNKNKTMVNKKIYMNHFLPIFNIMKFLNTKSIVSCSLVNKTFNKIANNNYLWKLLFEKDFGKQAYNYKNLLNFGSNKRMYIKYFIIQKQIADGDLKDFFVFVDYQKLITRFDNDV